MRSAAKLGPFDVVALLGKGGMGEVYRARDPQLNRYVVIKVLPASLANDTDYLARFQREAQTLASLNHPNIAVIGDGVFGSWTAHHLRRTNKRVIWIDFSGAASSRVSSIR